MHATMPPTTIQSDAAQGAEKDPQERQIYTGLIFLSHAGVVVYTGAGVVVLVVNCEESAMVGPQHPQSPSLRFKVESRS